jgi:cytochrome b561
MLPARNNASQWGWVSVTLHWVTVLAIIGLVIVGMTMDDLPNGPDKIRIYALHKSTGLTVLALTLLRLGWRLYAGAPVAPPMPRWQRLAAHASHFGLYALLLAMPLSGWLFNSAAGFPLKWFGWVKIPPLAAHDPALKALAREWHEGLAWTLLAMVALHVVAALKHHVSDRDATLQRMLPLLRLPAPRPPGTP